MPDDPTIKQKPKGLKMTLPARAENVALVRHALAGLAEEIGMDRVRLGDLQTVVTEACMNVAEHAYEGGDGPLAVEAHPDEAGLTVAVCDDGIGIQPRADTARASLRLGLTLIAALSSSFSVSGGIDGGTEVRMRVPLRGGSAGSLAGAPGKTKVHPHERTELVADSPELLAPVLARMVGALTARGGLAVERVSDAILVSDTIAAAPPGRFAGGRVRLGLDEDADGIHLWLGPMEHGAAAQIRMELETSAIATRGKLADALAVEESDGGEYLVIRFAAAP